jgi:hypothetical protein
MVLLALFGHWPLTHFINRASEFDARRRRRQRNQPFFTAQCLVSPEIAQFAQKRLKNAHCAHTALPSHARRKLRR